MPEATPPQPPAPQRPAGDAIRMAVIIGSTREGRLGPSITRWFLAQVQDRSDIDVEVIDLLDEVLPARLPDHETPEMSAFANRIAPADAFVVVTPEYNHSFPASLKHAIDCVHEQWFAKPVGFVSYGGVAAGLRAVEALRLVFAELHAVTMRDAVSIHAFDGSLDENGRVLDDGARRAAKTMLDQLTWWARALREARATRPYAG